MSKGLSESFIKSIGNEGIDIATDLIEVGLDSILEARILKDIPFVSTAVALFKIGNTIIDRHNVKKLATFINNFNKGITDEKNIEKYKAKLKANINKSEQEIEYLLIILARYIGYEKPGMLSKIFLAYLDEKITWDDLVFLSEVVDRLLPGDYNHLASAQMFTTKGGAGDHIMLRLEALGLIIEQKQVGALVPTSRGSLAITPESIANFKAKQDKRQYLHTDLGKALIAILGWRMT